MDIDRRAFIASLGGTTAVSLLSDEAKADALEEYMSARLNEAAAAQAAPAPAQFPSMAEIEAQIETRPTRRGVGSELISAGTPAIAAVSMPARSPRSRT